MRKFDITFRNDLRRKVESIEAAAGVEIVVAILPQASRYLEYHLGAALVAMVLTLSITMFVPFDIWYVYLYIYTVGAGILGGGALWVFPGLLRALVGKKQLQMRTDLRVNATFSRAKIYETRERVGILLMICWLERKVRLVPDTGVVQLMPPSELEGLEKRFASVFAAPNPAQAILEQLEAAKETLASFIPPDTHAINELPDDLWIE
jgi:uncharacterized membrane protein